ncbi:Inosose isomerase [Emticicia aquatica]|uniref:Inosose isomerase n=1 Tax=Emticicia aquatica TaxID=1681835 RepID=A0ABM9ALY3_9BACT|nr:TIM barrel protein [Emticicia aquatica]CAH0994553.1 Inosose isomerase [Emticicia aquatica]
MESSNISRRNLIKSTLATGAGLALGLESVTAKPQNAAKHNFSFCLNTSTIRKQNLGLMAEIELAAKVGYTGIEIWINTLESYVAKGGNLKDVRQKVKDLGIQIEDAIGFATWIVDDPNQRAKALEQTKREMGMLSEIGCKRIAAPPFGATNKSGIDLQKAAARYRKMLDLGDEMGVLPQLEMWGFSANLHLFGEALFVASETGHPKAVVLSDVYHLYKGGSDFNALKMLNGECMQMFHVNDYPANLSREKINDSYRVFPGDGVAPLDQIFQILNQKNTPIVLSLELFNEDYWKMPAFDAAKIGLEKMKASVAKAVGA